MAADDHATIEGRGAADARRRHRHRPHHPGAVPRARSPSTGSSSTSSRTTATAAASRAHGRIRSTTRAITGASVLLVNRNFGCGSSREHAPQALQRWGIQAVVGESFSEIFFGNSAMIGHAVRDGVARRRAGADGRGSSSSPQARCASISSAGTCEVDGFRCAVALPPNVRDAFVTGAWDTTGMLLDRYEEVDAAAARLPYVSGF